MMKKDNKKFPLRIAAILTCAAFIFTQVCWADLSPDPSSEALAKEGTLRPVAARETDAVNALTSDINAEQPVVHFDQRGFVNTAVIPDGTGGWTEISLGQEFKRVITLPPEKRALTGELMRAVKTRGEETALLQPAEYPAAQDKDRHETQVLLLTVGRTTCYGTELLTQVLRDNSMNADTLVLMDTDYLSEFVSVLERENTMPPNIIGISVSEQNIEQTTALIKEIRQRFPDAYVIIGGPETQHTEQLAVILDDFDVIIKGQADDAITDVVDILKDSTRTQGLNALQLKKLASLEGGILARTGNTLLYNNLAWTNVPEEFHLLRPYAKKMKHYWHTSRGCPRACRFCYKWSGRQYKLALPHKETGQEKTAPMYVRNAKAMKEWLLERLVLETNGQYTPQSLEEALAKPKERSEILDILPVDTKIAIEMTDDDFLVDRRRIKAFHDEILRLGLENYFYFTPIANVSSFIKQDAVDTELIHWLKDMNFRDIFLGTDGLCDGVLKQNAKGYTLCQAILVNKALAEGGLYPQHNLIWTTPETTHEELIEAMIMFHLLPWRFNVMQSPLILASLGSAFSNEYVIGHSQEYNWQIPGETIDCGHYFIKNGWCVPKEFPEYATTHSKYPLYPNNENTRALLEALQKGAISDLEAVGKPVLSSILKKWKQSQDTELKSIALLYEYYCQGPEKTSFSEATIEISEGMIFSGVYSFEDYYQKLTDGTIGKDKNIKRVMRCYEQGTDLADKRLYLQAEMQLKNGIKLAPRNPKLYYALTFVLLKQDKMAEAVEVFGIVKNIRYKPSTFEWLFEELLEKYTIKGAFDKNPAVFNNMRDGYFQLTLMSFICNVIEVAKKTAPVTRVDFKLDGIDNAINYYDLLETLSTVRVKDEMFREKERILNELTNTKKSSFLGVPFYIEGTPQSRTLVFDLDNIVTQRQNLEQLKDTTEALDGST
ncbi:MAG: cobalamin-dependent protein [Candidatus Omnitrophota bacterium]